MTLISYYTIHSNLKRFILSVLLFIFSIIICEINFKLGILLFLIGIACALTEYIFIKYMRLYWDYRQPDFLKIPFWLIPLWGIAIILIIQVTNIFKMIIT